MVKAIKNVRVFNGVTMTGMLTNVVIKGSYIASVGPYIPPMCESVEGHGMILLPGKINPKTDEFDIGKEAIEPGKLANFGLIKEHATKMESVWHQGVRVV